MRTSATNRRLRVLLTAISNKSLVPQPDFQRRLVWSNKDKVAFVRTVLEGFPFPEIYIAAGKVDPKTGEGCELLVDGQQRITTLYQYFKGSEDLKLPAELVEYSNLDEQKQLEFLEYEVVVRDLGSKPIDEVKEIFQRINSTSYGLNTMEIHNSRYAGGFKAFAETMSEMEFFSTYRIFTTTDIKRMNDVRFCLGMLSAIIVGYFNRDKEIEPLLERYNEEFDRAKEFEVRVSKVINSIERLNFPASSRAFKKADFYSIFIEVYKALYLHKKEIDISKTRDNIDEFFEKVEKASENKEKDPVANDYYKAALQGSNDRNNRILRGNTIQNLIV
ncbi:DUF262 domain-containing protein [Zhongshania aquimaris]|uniref:DUF262 domain-containing protein n=1 Tax=Zhongshania aquimaris TaxID=2857107 RepID=A0ABS6VNR4_9GAMM|nr:DUF262 domain-containing protein [Zhongshania aquimaris]MBW2939962.1 DUF262 domain-containing protein [Zhongshania aquimaris]